MQKGKISNKSLADKVIYGAHFLFVMVISSCSMIDLIQLFSIVKFDFLVITSPQFLAHYVNCLDYITK
jgi:hypothetical protein